MHRIHSATSSTNACAPRAARPRRISGTSIAEERAINPAQNQPSATSEKWSAAWNATTGAALYNFYAYAESFTGGVSVAAHDLNADGKADIITGSGIGSQGHVQVFSGANLAPLDSFYGFGSNFKDGVYVG